MAPAATTAGGVRLLPAADRTWSRWKNDGGATSEVVAWPESADLDGFQWRVSIAEIAASGTFSQFPGVDRVLTPMGTGRADALVLVVDGVEHAMVAGVPFAFPGESATYGRLRGGPVHDLNVMTRRGAWLADVEAMTLEGPDLDGASLGATAELPLSLVGATAVVVLVLEGSVAVTQRGGAVLLDGPEGHGVPAELGRCDALLLMGPRAAELTLHAAASRPPTRIARIRLTREHAASRAR